MSVKLNSSILFLLRIVKSFASIFILILTAKFFGVGFKMDNWVAVSTFFVALASLFFGAINEIFRYHFVNVSERKGENFALNEVYNLVFYTTVFCILGIGVCFLLKDNIHNLFFPDPVIEGNKQLFFNLLFLLLPLLYFNQLNAILTGILNSYEVFFIPEVVSIFSTLASIGIIFFLVPKIDIYSLVVSQYFSTFLLLLTLIFFIKRKGIKLKVEKIIPNLKSVQVYIYAAAPLILPYFFGQINAVTEKRFINFYGEGYLSYTNYSKQIIGVLQPVVFGVLMTIMVPQITKCLVKNDFLNYKKYSKEYFDVCMILCITIVPLLFGGQYFICSLLFKNGSIDKDSFYLITKLFGYYGLGFIGIVFYGYVGALYISLNKTKLYSVLGVFNQALILVLNALLYKHFSIEIFPIIFGGIHFLSAIILLLLLDKKYKNTLVYSFMKAFFVTFVLAFIVKFFNDQIEGFSILYIILTNCIIFFLLLLLSLLFTNNNIIKRYLPKF